MKLFGKYLKQHRMVMIAFAAFFAALIVSFVLYRLPVGAVIYPMFLVVAVGLIILIIDYRRQAAKHRELLKMAELSAELISDFPDGRTIDDEDYRRIIQMLCLGQRELSNAMDRRYSDMIDYYTMWAHQIKTPIAAMRLHIQNEDSDFSRKMSKELFRIEQYVEMVLVFLRLDSESTDYLIKEYDLDNIVKHAVRKFSSEFIGRKLTLTYNPLNTKVITDEKWLSFVVEQVISNALKYTVSGGITISLEEPKALCIRDTGMGIAPEDLPRIFEKGYTGYNGRAGKKSSGIGLYLSKRICRNLGHNIEVESQVDEGTCVRIDLKQRDRQAE